MYRQVNPIPYTATYFGEKLHIDQNEKLIMYGVTHVCAIDGFSGKIVGLVSMAVKNNSITIRKVIQVRAQKNIQHIWTLINQSLVICLNVQFFFLHLKMCKVLNMIIMVSVCKDV